MTQLSEQAEVGIEKIDVLLSLHSKSEELKKLLETILSQFPEGRDIPIKGSIFIEKCDRIMREEETHAPMSQI